MRGKEILQKKLKKKKPKKVGGDLIVPMNLIKNIPEIAKLDEDVHQSKEIQI